MGNWMFFMVMCNDTVDGKNIWIYIYISHEFLVAPAFPNSLFRFCLSTVARSKDPSSKVHVKYEELLRRFTFIKAYKNSSCPHTQRCFYTISRMFSHHLNSIFLAWVTSWSILRNHQLSAGFCWFSCTSSFPCPWKILCEARIAGCGFGGWESGEIPTTQKRGLTTDLPGGRGDHGWW